ncbi:MAG: cell wall-active antibiotics response protein LiaF [Chloroflexota bacterium]
MTSIRWWQMTAGALLIALGILFLLDTLGALSFGRAMATLWPLALILLGLLILWCPWRRCWRYGPKDTVVGDIRIGEGEGEWDLHEIDTRMGVGQLLLDLRRARIPQGETKLRVSGFVGNMKIVVPPGLAVSAQGEVGIGSISLLGQKAEGFGRQISSATADYEAAEKRVKVEMSLMVGEASIIAQS